MVVFTFNIDTTQSYLFLGNLGECILNPQFHNLGKFSILPMISESLVFSPHIYLFAIYKQKLDISDHVGLEVGSGMRGNEEPLLMCMESLFGVMKMIQN